jgi:hypothetical protein
MDREVLKSTICDRVPVNWIGCRLPLMTSHKFVSVQVPIIVGVKWSCERIDDSHTLNLLLFVFVSQYAYSLLIIVE